MEPVPTDETSESLLDILVSRLVGQGPPAHQVWLPPLSVPPTLDELLGPVTTDPARGLTFANHELHGALQEPVATWRWSGPRRAASPPRCAP